MTLLYTAPPLGRGGISRVEKLSGGVLDLAASGDLHGAGDLADREVKGAGGGRRYLADMEGVDPSLAGSPSSSKNIPVVRAAAGYVALEDAGCEWWLTSYSDQRWPLWRSETLSHVYSFILPALALALRFAVARQDDELSAALRGCLLRHHALLEALLWPIGKGKRARDAPFAPAKRTPYYRYGPRLSRFRNACWRPVPRQDASLGSDATGWPDRVLWAARLHELLDPGDWPRRLREEVTLEETLEVVTRGVDTSLRFLGPTSGGSTAPTAAVSDVDGEIAYGGVHRHEDRGGLGRTETKHVGDRIEITARGVDPSPKRLPPGVTATREGDRETLTRTIPAPPVAGAEVWHVGPGGWREGVAR